MRYFLLSHAVITVLAAAFVFLTFGRFASLSFLCGALVTLGNGISLCLVWPNILAKKLIALSVGVIIFKFAILIWIISIVANTDQLSQGWFGVGLAVVVLSAIATAMRFRKS